MGNISGRLEGICMKLYQNYKDKLDQETQFMVPPEHLPLLAMGCVWEESHAFSRANNTRDTQASNAKHIPKAS